MHPGPNLECADRSGWVERLDVQWEGPMGCDAGMGDQTRLNTGSGVWAGSGVLGMSCERESKVDSLGQTLEKYVKDLARWRGFILCLF